jgi:hypothetical protein
MQAKALNLRPSGGVTEKTEVRKEIPEGNTVGWTSRKVALAHSYAKLSESVEPKGSYVVRTLAGQSFIAVREGLRGGEESQRIVVVALAGEKA